MKELISKNQALECEVNEYENKLKKALDDQKQLQEKIDSSKNTGELNLKSKCVILVVVGVCFFSY